MSKTLGARFSLTAKPQDGVTYVIRTEAENVCVPSGASSTTFTGDCRFFIRKGGAETLTPFYVFIFVRPRNGERRRILYVNSKVSSVTGLEITVYSADDAIEIFLYDVLPTTETLYSGYVAKKEIPVWNEEYGKTFRCKWEVNGVEISSLAASAAGVPKGDFPSVRPLVLSLMMRDGDRQEAVVTDTGSLTVYAVGTNVSWNQAFTVAAMSYTLSATGSSTSVITTCTGLRAVWTSQRYGTLEFTLPKIHDGALGPRGGSGPVPVPKGIWQSDGIYTATAVQTMYVFDDVEKDFFFVKPPATGTKTAAAGIRPGLNPTDWERMGTMNPFYTRMAVINGGTVGKSVYWEEFMYSQFGRNRILDNNYNITGYEEVDGVTDSDHDGTPNTYGAPVQTGNVTDTFEPNLLLNFLTGEAVMKKATVEGTVRAQVLARSFVHCLSSASGNVSVLLPSQGNTSDFIWLTSSYVTWASLWQVGDDFLPSRISLDRTLQPSAGYTRVAMPPAQNFLGQEVELFTTPGSFELHIGGGSGSSGDLFTPGFGQSVIAVLAPRTVWATYGVAPGRQSSVRLLAVANGSGTYGWMILTSENCAINTSDTP